MWSLIGIILGVFVAHSPQFLVEGEWQVNAPFLEVENNWIDSLVADLPLEQKLGQLLVYKNEETLIDSVLAVELASEGLISGFVIEGDELSRFLNIQELVNQKSNLPLFWGTTQRTLLNNQFTDLNSIPNAAAIQAIQDQSVKDRLQKLYLQQAIALGINFTIGNTDGPSAENNLWSQDPNLFLNALNQNRILNLTNTAPSSIFTNNEIPYNTIYPFKRLARKGVSGFELTQLLSGQAIQFDGLLTGRQEKGTSVQQLIESGADLIVVKDDPKQAFQALLDMHNNGKLSLQQINQRLSKVLKAKYWTNHKDLAPKKEKNQPPVLAASVTGNSTTPEKEALHTEEIIEHFEDDKWRLLQYLVYESALVLATNPNDFVPIRNLKPKRFRILEYGEKRLTAFEQTFSRYANLYSEVVLPGVNDALPAFRENVSVAWTHIITLDNLSLNAKRDSAFLAQLNQLAGRQEIILINFGSSNNLRFLPPELTIIQAYESNEITHSLAAQLIFGGIPAKGRLGRTINNFFTEGTGIDTRATRVKFTIPEAVGIAPEKLVGIDAIFKTAISNRVIPGGQVLVAKEGNIIYSKSFGYHTFRKKQPVKNTDLYDLASITKVASTTLATMRLVEHQRIGLNDRLKDRLIWDEYSSIGNIKIQKLLTHQSGLQPNMPIAPYILAKTESSSECARFFCSRPSEEFGVQLGDDFYFAQKYQDSIWQKVHRLRLDRYRRYRYSDVNFMLLQRVVEDQTQMPLDTWMNWKFYSSLGLRRTLYNPINRFDKKEIVPTQLDRRWRKQLVHGFVHDETAALFGGVGGNAGLFSNAEDLAVLFQMLLNRGNYGGKSYLSEGTVEFFTSAWHGNHRGLGFDKPGGRKSYPAYSLSASTKTYGHTGFTGTCVWVDPAHDLVYIFLSNRIHPNTRNPKFFSNNIRQRIHQVVYDGLDSFDRTIPELQVDAEISKS